DQRNKKKKAVEELKYRRSLKIALDILNQNVSPGQVSASEGPSFQLSQENNAGSLSSTPLRRHRSLKKKKQKLEPETAKKKREQKNKKKKRTDTKKTNQKGSFILEEKKKTCESETKPSKCTTGDLCNTSNSQSQNGKIPESKSLPSQEKTKPRLLPKSKPGNNHSVKPKEEKNNQGKRRQRGAGSPVSRRNELPEDPAQPLAEEGSPEKKKCKSGTALLLRKANTRSQPRRTLPDSSCKSASDNLEKHKKKKSKSLVKQLGGKKKPVSLKQVNGEGEISVALSSYSKRKTRNGPESSSGSSNHGTLSDSFTSQQKEEENKNASHLVLNEVKQFQLPDFEEDEEPQSIEEGILVWCKLRRYPYWPAVVKRVKRKHRKACVLLIEGNTSDKKKGFSVPLKNLKHFDCREKQDLIERAKENYRQEIEWCVRLISDYRIRVGCHSFTGSFLEYFAADISYPVRKEGYHTLVQMTFPNAAEEDDVEESPSETSPQKPSKKLLPDRTRAARDKANKKIVEFIVKTKGAEEHLLSILKSRKPSRWLKDFLKSSQYMTCVETYLEDEEQLDLVVNYLKEVYREIDTENLHRIDGDGIKFISDVLLPEAIIYAKKKMDDIDYQKAEEKYIKGPKKKKR
ncbi:MUM1 protein, partial [Chordeiles acutipennis]|nr:MUM1 protein [Chordeiles acutipennis]